MTPLVINNSWKTTLFGLVILKSEHCETIIEKMTDNITLENIQMVSLQCVIFNPSVIKNSCKTTLFGLLI
jgi:hypothetical protein